jgi:hypothetical protein
MLALSILLFIVIILLLRLAYYESFSPSESEYNKHQELNNLYDDLITYFTRLDKPSDIDKKNSIKLKCSSAPKTYSLKSVENTTTPKKVNDVSKHILNITNRHL